MEQCPAHRAGISVTVTERDGRTTVCLRKTTDNKPCNLQPGHDGDCE